MEFEIIQQDDTQVMEIDEIYNVESTSQVVQEPNVEQVRNFTFFRVSNDREKAGIFICEYIFFKALKKL